MVNKAHQANDSEIKAKYIHPYYKTSDTRTTRSGYHINRNNIKKVTHVLAQIASR